MSDVNFAKRPAGPPLLFLRDKELREGIELLFYAYRDFTREPDEILHSLGLGRDHHRALHFIGRNPSITVSELVAILGITKQSLARVLRDLIDGGYIAQMAGESDRRRRHLSLTESGLALEQRLSAPQRARFARAFRDAGPEAVDGFRRVLIGLIDEPERERIVGSFSERESG
ncbi:MAG: MarR family transcriptional regulator [Alphaproteobacteria bacterium]|nr:MarR family transcriptional regulator [Alphaproteobacteria bacterium]